MKRRIATGWVALLAVLGALVAVPAAATPSWAATSNVTVSFGTTVRSVSRTQFGLDVTGYGYGNYITNDAAEQAMLNGKYGVMRMGLKYSTDVPEHQRHPDRLYRLSPVRRGWLDFVV